MNNRGIFKDVFKKIDRGSVANLLHGIVDGTTLGVGMVLITQYSLLNVRLAGVVIATGAFYRFIENNKQGDLE